MKCFFSLIAENWFKLLHAARWVQLRYILLSARSGADPASEVRVGISVGLITNIW